MLVRRCEECLREPGDQGTCPKHPYARIIGIDDADADEERALMRRMSFERIQNFGLFLGVILGSLLLVLLTLQGPFLGVGLLFFSGFIAVVLALLLPPILFIRQSWANFFGTQPRWPAWAWAGLWSLGWLTLMAGGIALKDLQLIGLNNELLLTALGGGLALSWVASFVFLFWARIRYHRRIKDALEGDLGTEQDAAADPVSAESVSAESVSDSPLRARQAQPDTVR